MNTNHGTQRNPAGPKSVEGTPSMRNRMLMSIAVALGLVLIAVAVGLVLSSCGSNTDESASAQPATQPSEQVVVASVGGAGLESSGSTTGALEPSSNSAPDLDATVTQSIVLPGDSVEVVARATSDAVSVTLWDGYQERTQLTYDAATNLWSGSYRVPLRASWDRLGLSVTAKNDENRWSRVWVFLNMREEETQVPESDSLGSH